MVTTFKTPTDFRKSLETRLKNITNKNSLDLQRTRRKLAFERLLARIMMQVILFLKVAMPWNLDFLHPELRRILI
jgi:hypothetical protein